MSKFACTLFAIFIAVAFNSSCQDSVVVVELDQELDELPDQTEDTETDESGDERIFITDRTGKRWDITHAVKVYGFEPNKFQFGLGPNAIKPILDPQMVCPGEQGYPERDADDLVLGVRLNGHTRAYPLRVMSRHEVAEEVFGDTYVAVAY